MVPLLLVLLLLLGPPLPARADRGDFRLTDTLQILVLAREVRALNTGGGHGPTAALELGERVHWQGSRGRVGLVLTNRRLLAVTPDSAAWQEVRFRVREDPPLAALLGERVAVAATALRAIGFDGGSGNLLERDLGPGERVLVIDSAENVAVVVTDRRALAVSPFTGGFYEAELRTGETLRSVQTTGDLASVRTTRRLLRFQAPTGLWSAEPLSLDDR